MAKQKERSEVEYLRGQLKTLKSEIRHLKKELGKFQKREHLFASEDPNEIEEALDIIFPIKKCPVCQTQLIETDIGPRILIKCSSCEYKTTKKKHG